MAKNTKPVVDPTLPTADVEIGGKTYTLCLGLSELADAEAKLLRSGHKVELLIALAMLGSLDGVLTVFAAALQRHHPEVGYEEARKLPSLPEVYTLRAEIEKLWQASMPKPAEDAGKRP